MMKWLVVGGLLVTTAAVAADPVAAPPPVAATPADPEVTMRLSELQLIINAVAAQQIAASAMAKMQQQIKATK